MGDEAFSLPWIDIAGIIACLVCSAFFSGSETALTHISDTRARHLVESRQWGILNYWLENKRRILSTLLVGNNIVNILCSILAYRVALTFLPSYAEAVSVFGLTLVILVFAEITPKSLALHYSERIVVPVLRLVWVVDKILWFVSAPLARVPELFLRRSRDGLADPQLTEDEIEFQIRLGHDQEVFEEKEQGDLLMSAVEFTAIQVKEVMVPRTDIFGLDMSTPLSDAVEAAIESGHSRIPVYSDNLDRIRGLLYSKDLLRYLNVQYNETLPSLESIVRKGPIFAPETQKISDLLTEMRKGGQHMAVVVDEFGGTSGLITLEDIIEELVGEIRDEFDEDESMLLALDDDTWVVDARLTIHDLRDATGITLPDTGDYESVGGFVIAAYGSIPSRGTVIEAAGLRFTVLAADARRVKKIEMKRGDAEERTAREE
ncbi:MAG: HlyC/CorC family transporter [Deltaproteobacteria bacterium]|nr:HlyC/CorC family transporter [Deltaproteobacteria bacterium]